MFVMLISAVVTREPTVSYAVLLRRPVGSSYAML